MTKKKVKFSGLLKKMTEVDAARREEQRRLALATLVEEAGGLGLTNEEIVEAINLAVKKKAQRLLKETP